MAGTVIDKGNGKYKLSYMYHSQRYYKTVKAENEQAARKLLKVFVQSVKQISQINPDICTLEEFIPIYISTYAKDYLAVECIYNYYHALQCWVLPKIGKTTLSNCTTPLFKKYFKWLKNQKSSKTNEVLATTSVEKIFGIVSSVFNCIFQWHILDFNPVQKARPEEFKQKNKRKNIDVKERCLTPDESKRLIKELENVDIKYKIIIHLAIMLGLRRSEILGIKWADLDLENCTLKLEQSSIYVCKLGYFESDLKTPTSYRTIALPRITTKLLKEYRKTTLNIDNDFVFVNDKGRRKNLRLNPSSLTNWFCAFRKKVKLPANVPLQGIRHTNATLLLIRGTDVKSVSSRLGHSNTATTLDIYSEALPEVDKTTSEIMDKVLCQRQKQQVSKNKRRLIIKKKEQALSHAHSF